MSTREGVHVTVWLNRKPAVPASTAHVIDAGLCEPSLYLGGGMDVDVSVNGHLGEVTLVQGQDGCFWSWGSSEHWVDSGLLAYIRTLPDPDAVLNELALVAGAVCDRWRDEQ